MKLSKILNSIETHDLVETKYQKASISCGIVFDHSLDFPEGIDLFKKYNLDIKQFRLDVDDLIRNSVEDQQYTQLSINNGVGVQYKKLRVDEADFVQVQVQAQNLEIQKQQKNALSIGPTATLDGNPSLQTFLRAFLLLKNQFSEVSRVYRVLKKNGFDEERFLNDWDNSKVEEKSFLDEFATNLNEEAMSGKIKRVIGRSKEIDEVITALLKAEKNSPILIGEAGVGKTAIAEGLALEIINGRVPEQLKNTTIYNLDMMSLMKGTGLRGAYEEKVDNFIKAVKEKEAKNEPVLIFIDEIHTIMGTGAGNESNNFGNLLKPHLAKGKIRIIGATTEDEWHKFIKKDGALDRRFDAVMVPEPSVEDTKIILEGSIGFYETFHKLKYDREVIPRVLELTSEFVADKNHPDKDFDLIDYTGSRIKKAGGELVTVKDIEEALVYRYEGISEDAIMERKKLKKEPIEDSLKKVIFGQDHVIEKISPFLEKNLAGLSDPNKPIASFMFAGPTGTGKTQLAKEIEKVMNMSMISLNMNTFSEGHSVSKIVGSPAGYVGSEDGSPILKEITKKPRMVFLLDEFEKAHPNVQNLFLNAMDEGYMKDAQNKHISLRNAIFILTTNQGQSEMKTASIGLAKKNETAVSDKGKKSIELGFKPELLARLSGQEALVFNFLSEKSIDLIIDKELIVINEKFNKSHNLSIKISDKIRSNVKTFAQKMKKGARPIKGRLDTLVTLPMSMSLNHGDLQAYRGDKGDFKTVLLDLDKDNKVNIKVL